MKKKLLLTFVLASAFSSFLLAPSTAFAYPVLATWSLTDNTKSTSVGSGGTLTVTAGDSLTLAWNATGVTTCSAVGFTNSAATMVSGTNSVSSSGSVTFTVPVGSYAFNFGCNYTSPSTGFLGYYNVAFSAASPPLAVSCTPSSTQITAGNSVTWYGNATGGQTIVAGNGTWGIYAYGTDFTPASVGGVSGTCSPNPPSGSCNPTSSSNCIDNPNGCNLSGGNCSGTVYKCFAGTPSGSYAYSWSGTSGPSGTTASVSQTYSSVGTYSASLNVIDGSQNVTSACSSSVNVCASDYGNSCTATSGANACGQTASNR